jgi:uncharacterized protein YjbI with pentapeptide repeats
MYSAGLLKPITDWDLNKAALDRIQPGVNRTEANLVDADLPGTDLDRANLSGVRLAMANMAGVNLGQADLSNTDLSGADHRPTYLPRGACGCARRGTGLAGARGRTLGGRLWFRGRWDLRDARQ